MQSVGNQLSLILQRDVSQTSYTHLHRLTQIGYSVLENLSAFIN